MGSTKDDALDEELLEDVEKIIDRVFTKPEETKNDLSEEKRPFLKTGLILIVVALICLGVVVYAPWAYVNCDSYDKNQITEEFIYYGNYDIENEEVKNIFNPPSNNCTNSSCQHTNLNFDDFTQTPNMAIYSFIFLMIIGLLFVIFQIIDKVQTFSEKRFITLYSTFSMFSLIVSVFILLLMTKFIAIYFSLFYNSEFIYTKNIIFISPAAIVIICILLGLIKINFSVMIMNFHSFQNERPA